MASETATYSQELRWILDQMAKIVSEYPSGRLDWSPATGTANSAYAITTHVVSSTRVYVLGFGCGWEVGRDREAEFAAAGDEPRDLITAARDLAEEVESGLAALDPPALERRLLPPRHLWGVTTEPREISARDAIVMSIRHAALHLGELRLTRDLAERDRASYEYSATPR